MRGLDERENPYVGLRPFFDEDALYFFGRKDQTLDLLDLLRESRFVPVVGSSGSGKSSLVRAGLMPMLQAGFMVADRDGWRMAKCRPGDAPLENLAEALQYAMGEGRKPAAAAALAQRIREEHTDAVVDYLAPRLAASDNVFILVDQFEELFAFRSAAGDGDDDGVARVDVDRTADRIRRRQDAASLVSLLLALSQQSALPLYISLTMRTDFLGDCDLFTGLPEAINRSGYLVPRLTRLQLREAVVGPARLMRGRVAPRLVDRVLNDVGDRGDRLPVMQHALLRTWEMWRAHGAVGPLDLEHFDEAGGLEHALDRQAEDTVAVFDMTVVERVFKRLTTTDVSRRRVRSPARFSELVAVSGTAPELVEALLNRCCSEGVNFLYRAPDGRPEDPRFDIVHESLIRQWTRLREWVDEERDTRDWWQETSRKALADAESPGDELLTPRALQIALERLAQHTPTAEWAARYGSGGAGFADTMAYIEKCRNASRRRRVRRLAWRGGTAAVVVGLSLVGAYNGWLARNRLSESEASSRAMAIERLATEDPTYASALAAEFGPTQLESLDTLGLVQRVLAGATALAEYSQAYLAALSDSGTTVAIVDDRGTLRIQAASGTGPVVSTATDTLLPADLRFAHNGQSVYLASTSGVVRRIARDDGRELASWTVSARPLKAVRESNDGGWLVAIDDQGALYRWKPTDRSVAKLLIDSVAVVEFDPGRPGTVIVGTTRGVLRRGNLAATPQTFTFIDSLNKTQAELPHALVVHPSDGSFIVLGVQYTTGYYAKDKPMAKLSSSLISSAAFSPDGELAALGTAMGRVEVYDIKRRQIKWAMPLHTQRVTVGFSSTSEAVVSMSDDRTGRWTLVRDTTQSIKLNGHRADIYSLHATTYGQRFATVDYDNVVRVWDKPDSWNGFTPAARVGTPRAVALAEQGTTVVTTFDDGSVIAQFPGNEKQDPIWMPRDDGDNAAIDILAVSPDGRRVLAVPNDDGTPLWWTVANVAPKRLATGIASGVITHAVFSQDGRHLLLANSEGRIVRVDGQTGTTPSQVFDCEAPVDQVAISKDGAKVAVWCLNSSAVMLIGPEGVMQQPLDKMQQVYSMRFSPDGHALVIAGFADHSLLLETSGAYRMRRLVGQQRDVWATAFSHDGTRLATGGADKSIELYSMWPFVSDSGNVLDELTADESLKGHRTAVSHLTFSTDNQRLVSTGSDGAVRVWQLDGGDAYGTLLANPAPLPPSPNHSVVASAIIEQPRRVISVGLSVLDDFSSETGRKGIARFRRWHLDPDSLIDQVRQRSTVCIPLRYRQSLVPLEQEAAQVRTNDCAIRNGRVPE